MKLGYYVAALAAMSSVVCAPANAACWAPRAAEAAQVRDFETMLMVATLRCRVNGVDMSDDYNRFVREKRAVLVGVNDELRAQFTPGRTSKAALDAYDRFVTAIANSHGAGSANLGCADFQAMAQAANAAPADRAALLALAVRAGSDPALPAERCASTQVASAR